MGLPEDPPLGIVGRSQDRLKSWIKGQPLMPKNVILITTTDHARGRYLSGVIFIDPPSAEMVDVLAPCLAWRKE